MVTKITDEMLNNIGAHESASVWKARRILAAAGVTDVELHSMEIAQAVKYAEDARVAMQGLRRILALGPAPAEHTCELRDDGRVVWHGDCPFGCRPGEPRIELPSLDASPDTSDGYHTFTELYEHRRALTAVLAAAASADNDSWRSKAHHPDDSPIYDGYFIVGIKLPTGTITYHYELAFWDDFAAVPVLPHAPKWDGATPADTVKRCFDLAREVAAEAAEVM